MDDYTYELSVNSGTSSGSSTSSAPDLDLDEVIFDLDTQLDDLSCKADSIDYLVAIGSGLTCSMLDILWVGEFSLENARNWGVEKTEDFVVQCARQFAGFSGSNDDLKGAISCLENTFPMASDGNTPDFGGGLQHHLRDFSHHPSIVGLACSLLTQFTGMTYGTNTAGEFIVCNVSEASMQFIGKTVPEKIWNGTIGWFFHLVSDMAGSSSTAGLSGGTGIPGPILSIAKELSTLPFFQSVKVDGTDLSVFLSKLFNGTLLAQHDETGRIIKDTQLRFDLRTELGIGHELTRQAVPVVANECMVRAFYFLHHLAIEAKAADVRSIEDFKQIDRPSLNPADSPTLSRMLAVATGVFTTVDVADALVKAIAKGQVSSAWLSVNWSGVGRFGVAIGREISWVLKRRHVREIRDLYAGIEANAYTKKDNDVYVSVGTQLTDIMQKELGLTVEQTEVLYNLERLKTKNDIKRMTTVTRSGEYTTQALKNKWLMEWQELMQKNYASFLGTEDAELHWYSEPGLKRRILEIGTEGTWLKLALLEAMIFEPYYPLKTELNKKGQEVPSKEYDDLKGPLKGYKQSEGDAYLQELLSEHLAEGYVERLRSSYDKALREVSGNSQLVTVGVGAVAAVALGAVAVAFAPQIAVLLVGSSFSGLSGAALSSACLAYLGGGAVAAGGAGMAGGTAVIVGGGALVGAGAGAAAGGATSSIFTNASTRDTEATKRESAKLIVVTREIILKDEDNVQFARYLCDQYADEARQAEHELIDLRYDFDEQSRKGIGLSKEEQDQLIRDREEVTKVFKRAQKSLSTIAYEKTGKNVSKTLPGGDNNTKQLPKASDRDSKNLPEGSDDGKKDDKGLLSHFGF